MLSQGEEEAFDLISKCVFIDNNLPEFLRESRDPNQRGFIGFPSVNSEIKALASTEKAGRSTDATLVVCDEWEFHPYAENNFAALKPTIDAGGQFIGLSTADKTRLDTHFKYIYNQARSGISNFKNIFLPWNLRPDRSKDWFESIKRDMKPHQVEQEYPECEEDALSTLKTRKFFDVDAVSQMRRDVLEPLNHDLSDRYKELVRIYKLPVIGGRYLCFTDPSDGKEDPHAIIVIDAKTGEQVAESHGKTPADLCAQIHHELVLLYDAFNGYELNSRAGGIFSQKLKDLDTPKQCGFLNVDKTLNKTKTGWWTSKTLWNTLIWEFEEAVRLGQVRPHSKECLDEFNNFIVPEGEDPQKVRGGSDDYIDAWSRVWYLRRYIPTGGIKISSGKYNG